MAVERRCTDKGEDDMQEQGSSYSVRRVADSIDWNLLEIILLGVITITFLVASVVVPEVVWEQIGQQIAEVWNWITRLYTS